MNTRVMDVVLKLAILLFIILYIFSVYNAVRMNNDNISRDEFINSEIVRMHKEVIDSLNNNIEILTNKIKYRDTIIFNNNIEKTNIIHEMDSKINHVSSTNYNKDSIRMFFSSNY